MGASLGGKERDGETHGVRPAAEAKKRSRGLVDEENANVWTKSARR